MSLRNWQIITAVVSVFFLVSMVFLILFGLKISAFNKDKTKEIKSNLARQQIELQAECQKVKEVITTTFIADSLFGSFQFDYPKVWYTFASQTSRANLESLTFLGDPGLIILDDADLETAYSAIRIKVIPAKYLVSLAETEKKYIGKMGFTESDVTVSGIKGKSFIGKPKDRDVTIKFYLIPSRDKTIYIGTDDLDKFSANLDTIAESFKIIE